MPGPRPGRGPRPRGLDLVLDLVLDGADRGRGLRCRGASEDVASSENVVLDLENEERGPHEVLDIEDEVFDVVEDDDNVVLEDDVVFDVEDGVLAA